jgi:hypothetical protein
LLGVFCWLGLGAVFGQDLKIYGLWALKADGSAFGLVLDRHPKEEMNVESEPVCLLDKTALYKCILALFVCGE